MTEKTLILLACSGGSAGLYKKQPLRIYGSGLLACALDRSTTLTFSFSVVLVRLRRVLGFGELPAGGSVAERCSVRPGVALLLGVTVGVRRGGELLLVLSASSRGEPVGQVVVVYGVIALQAICAHHRTIEPCVGGTQHLEAVKQHGEGVGCNYS